MFKELIKKILGERLILLYHLLVAKLACLIYRNPSKKLTVIGITGTKGKTTTANYIWAVLNEGGIKTGLLSTVHFGVGNKVELNDKHMTMPGRFFVQKKLGEMVDAGCTHAVIETPSEGIKQHRHSCIDYSTAIFTSLTPEHLASHGGSFQKYKEAKGKLFATLSAHNGKTLIIANSDDEHASYFLSFAADKKITYALNSPADHTPQDINETADTVSFNLGGSQFTLHTPGRFNIYNALPAIIIARSLGISDAKINEGFKNLGTIPGRMEEIETSKQGFRVFVDYAHEAASLTAVLKTARKLAGEHSVIVLTGGQGGGRDKSKRPAMGAVAAELADFCIVANEDPYDDDPLEIIEDIARAAEHPPTGGDKVRGQNLFAIEDRREGIKKALELANVGDVVLITGKGAEQTMIVKGKALPWDDRKITQELLRELNK